MPLWLKTQHTGPSEQQGLATKRGHTLAETVESDERPTELVAASALVIAAGKRGKQIPAGTRGASAATRLYEWGFKDIAIEPKA